jgi:hypothetical protein
MEADPDYFIGSLDFGNEKIQVLNLDVLVSSPQTSTNLSSPTELRQ